jgi:hypothetical protein
VTFTRFYVGPEGGSFRIHSAKVRILLRGGGSTDSFCRTSPPHPSTWSRSYRSSHNLLGRF